MRHEGIPYLDKNKDVADSIGHATSMMDEFEKFTNKADVNFLFYLNEFILGFFFFLFCFVLFLLICSIEIVQRRILNPVEDLRWSFLRNGLKP